MRCIPLILHAGARVPALTSLFSDTLPATSMAVVANGQTTITTASPHGFVVGSHVGFSVVDADVPNRIVHATTDGHDWLFETEYPHDLTFAPTQGTSVRNWNTVARLAGFGEAPMNGLLQLVNVPSATTFVVKPPIGVETVTLTSNCVLLERLEDGIVGWHKMVVTSATQLQFATPEAVARSYTVASPTIAKNIRIFGAIDFETAQDQYTRGYKTGVGTQDEAEVQKAWMVITPPPSVTLSKDRSAQGDAVAEMTPNSDYRQLLLDGFTVYVFLPAEQIGAGVACSDLASGEILSVVLRTFHGLILPRRELYQADTFVALMVEHGFSAYNKATYVHGYVFQAPAYLTQLDAIQPFEWSAINETQMTASSGLGPGTSGGVIDTTQPIAPPVSVAFRSLVLGIQHDDAPQPLTATVDLS